MNNIKTPEALLDFMSKNINYGYLGKNGRVYHYDDIDFNVEWEQLYILESPSDVLKNLYGNCWDQVEFERKWFLKEGYQIKTIYEMVKLDYDNNYPTHTFLIYKDNEYWCWFENADFNNRGIRKFMTIDELLNYQYKKYLDFLKTFNITSEEIEKIIMTEFDKPKEHINVKEYLEHVINSKEIKFNKNIEEPKGMNKKR
ncbi:MAG: hypothetical protein IJ568_07010 [Bacilli bacterium]|nr:hypothetical protein [Bacilli bacterium]